MSKEKGKPIFSLLETAELLPFEASKKDALVSFYRLVKRWDLFVKRLPIDELIKKIIQDSGIDCLLDENSEEKKSVSAFIARSLPFSPQK